MANNPQKCPKEYYSFYTNDNGKIVWTLIQQGISLTAERDNKEDVIKVAIRYKMNPSLPMWNGDKGVFEGC